MPPQDPDLAFTKALPKIELHAHLTGSISRATLHKIWCTERTNNPDLALPDPLTAIPSGDKSIDVVTFFPIFDKYIYNLISTLETIKFATRSILEDFLDDGVVYLELRTTPRCIPAQGISKEDYVRAVLETMSVFMKETQRRMVVNLILSVDRRNTIEEALEVVDLALKYRFNNDPELSRVLALDLCGNPLRTPITHLAPAFAKASTHSLPLTLHFAETPTSSSPTELSTLLSWNPQRLGHVIHVPATLKQEIASRKLGLELCLSCNVQSGLSTGGYAAHHFGYWLGKGCLIALCTDDVGIFESELSREYFLAATHFGLSRGELVKLARGAVEAVFGGVGEKARLRGLIDGFAEGLGVSD